MEGDNDINLLFNIKLFNLFFYFTLVIHLYIKKGRHEHI